MSSLALRFGGKGLLAFAFAFTLPLLTHAETEKAIKPGKAYVRLLSYNVKGLPSIINSYKKARFPIIGKMLHERRVNGTAPEIVLLQESFIDPTIAIQTESGYPYVSKGPSHKGVNPDGKKFSKLLNGGIYIMSEYPFTKEARINFPSNSCKSFDCYSNKGGQYVSVKVPGIPFELQVLNTHAQSSSRYDDIRLNQFAWLNYFARSNVNYNDPYRAMIFAGDFNSRPLLPSYAYFRDLAEVTNVGEVCLSPDTTCITKAGTDPAWLLEKSKDQIFYASGKKVRIRPLEVERNFTEQYKGKMLSDHFGYETLLEISWQ
jgi:endonuclease/exonuclease/phosphatase family metal-dependent hydrolase